MTRVIRYNCGPLDNNTYVLVDEPTGLAAVVDPSFDSAGLWTQIVEAGWNIVWVLNTHGHIDHVVENALYVEVSGAPLALHEADLPMVVHLAEQAAWLGVEAPRPFAVTHNLAGMPEIRFGDTVLRVLHTPGHSPGSVTFAGDGFAIAGDVLFAGSIGRTDLPGGNHQEILTSISTHLLSLPDDTRLHPGHGSETTIGAERLTNPFLTSL